MGVEVTKLDKTFVKQHSCQFIEGGRGGWGTGEF